MPNFDYPIPVPRSKIQKPVPDEPYRRPSTGYTAQCGVPLRENRVAYPADMAGEEMNEGAGVSSGSREGCSS
ncbi:hypothetical protein E4U22_006383 [Claviceps purpurea]|nr:hypothetical protein E4U22_006383 [Claviceps purpurea]